MVGGSLAFVGMIMVMGQSTLPGVVIPRLGEKRTALTGLAIGAMGYAGYAFASQGWMMFAWLFTWLLAALVMPSTQALMTHRVAADAQGELQGAVAGLHSLSAIVAPPLMTQMFRRFTAADAPVHFPGAPFLLASTLAVGALLVFWRSARSDAREEGAV